MATNDAIRAVLARYPPDLHTANAEYLAGAGGLSGSRFWRLDTSRGIMCLRRWPPEHPNQQRLRLIHAVLRHAAQRGIRYVPLPVATVQGETFIRHRGHLWELAPWMPGRACDDQGLPCRARLRAAIATLGEFHSCISDFPHPSAIFLPSPGVKSRLDLLVEFASGGADQVRQAIARWPEYHPLRPLAPPILQGFFDLAPQTQGELASHVQLAVRLQPAIRDIHCQNVLFEGDRVSGIVDFGAMNIESPAADVARLLGSMAEDDEPAGQAGLAAYEAVRPLSDAERRLLSVFDRSSVVLSGMNWLRWIFVDRRTFGDEDHLERRLRTIIRRLHHLQRRAE